MKEDTQSGKPKNKDIGNRPESSEIERLDSELKERGLLPVSKSEEKSGKQLVETLRRARDFERRVLYKQDSKESGLFLVQKKLGDISTRNKQIENQISIEILGIQDSPLKKLNYVAKQFYQTKIRGQPQQRAEDIISAQLNVIGEVANVLKTGSECIDGKLQRLENYYDRVLLNMLSKYNDRKKTIEEISKTSALLSETENVTKNSEDFAERLLYSRAHRNLKKNLQNDMLKLKITDKGMLLLKNELPLLDNLSDVCGAYSSALKETYQEASFMARHLENVMELYFDMVRSQKVNFDLESEVGKLFVYTNNMNNSIKKGASQVISKANSSELFTKEYQTNSLTLETILGDIESSNSKTFKELENRIGGYLSS